MDSGLFKEKLIFLKESLKKEALNILLKAIFSNLFLKNLLLRFFFHLQQLIRKINIKPFKSHIPPQILKSVVNKRRGFKFV